MLATAESDEESDCMYGFKTPLQVLAMPKLQCQEIPNDLSVKIRLFPMHFRQSVEKAWEKITALASAGIVQEILHQPTHPWILKKPLGQRNAKTVLFLV